MTAGQSQVKYRRKFAAVVELDGSYGDDFTKFRGHRLSPFAPLTNVVVLPPGHR